MALNVSYKNRIGYYTETQTFREITQKHKIWLCHANALCAMMYFYVNTENGKRKQMAQLTGFFADLTHAKKCIKDGYFTEWNKCSNFHFYAKEMNKDLWELAQLIADSGIKVTIE